MLVVVWGTGSARKMEGGGYCTSRAAPEEAAAGTAGQGAACMPLGFFFLSFLFFFPFPFPFHHLFAQTVPAAPVTLILPVLPHLLQLGAAWGRLGPHGQLLGREEGARHRSGRDWVPRWSGLRGSWGESKNRFFF